MLTSFRMVSESTDALQSQKITHIYSFNSIEGEATLYLRFTSRSCRIKLKVWLLTVLLKGNTPYLGTKEV